jgi:hypothetical protein
MNPSSNLAKIEHVMRAHGMRIKLKVSVLSNEQTQIKANLAS